jgi:hypothetical protein
MTHALVFGGAVPTATDYASAGSTVNLQIGDPLRVTEDVRANAEEYKVVLKGMLEDIIDRMKTNADDIDVLLVGGVRGTFGCFCKRMLRRAGRRAC